MARLSAETPFLHPDCQITDTTFGRFVEIGKGSRVAHSSFGDYSYCDQYSDIANTTVGKFANIAAFTRLGPTDHPLHTASCHHFLYRSQDYWDDAGADEAWFAHRRSRRRHRAGKKFGFSFRNSKLAPLVKSHKVANGR